jgi:hypothetical protein
MMEYSFRESRLGWVVMIVLLLIQAILFCRYVQREVAPIFPTGYDQSTYLTYSYQIHEDIRSNGLLHGLCYGLNAPVANGVLLHLQAALIYSLIGPSRLSALLPNFVYFAIFQVTIVKTLRWLSGRWTVALFGLGLLLSATSPYFGFGDLLDFRIDSIALSLFGIFICVVVRSGFFSSLPFSLLAGAVGALLILFRFITFVYLAGIFAICLLALCSRTYTARRDLHVRKAAIHQIVALVLAGLIGASLAVPVLCYKYQFLWDYYVVNCFMGGDKENRMREFGVETLLNAVLFYPKCLWRFHTRPRFLLLAGAGLATAVIGTIVLRRRNERRDFSVGQVASYGFAAACFVVPLTVLTTTPSKSPVVAGILLPPLLWLVTLPLVGLAKRFPGNTPHFMPWLFAGLSSLAVVWGMSVPVGKLTKAPPWWNEHHLEAAEVDRMYHSIAARAREMDLHSPSISVDCMKDYLAAGAMASFVYERDGFLLDLRPRLGLTVMAVRDDDAIATVRASDFVILSDKTSPTNSVYPFDHSMEALRPTLREFCDHNCTLLDRFHLPDRDLLLYSRPVAKVPAAVASK